MSFKWIFAISMILSFQVKAIAPAQLQNSVEFILQQVLLKKNQTFNPNKAVPVIFYQSQTPLSQFQDALETQWGFRPDVFTNAYAFKRNEIYMLDEAAYYHEHQRCMDDSVAHELTHYVQAQYQGFDLNDESLEWDAIDVQTWFRENFCKF